MSIFAQEREEKTNTRKCNWW